MRRTTIIRQALQELIEMFASGKLPEAVALTVIKPAGDRPSDRWSLGNRLLMLLAGTEDARGYRQWQKVGRHVKKGSKAFYIFAPVFDKRKVAVEDPKTGRQRKEEREILLYFRPVPVFRYEDTEGAPLNEPDYSPPELPPLYKVAKRFRVKVEYRAQRNWFFRGWFHFGERKIVLQTHDVKTFFHELAHAAHAQLRELQGGQHPDQEIVAEVAAAALCKLYGYEGYLKHSSDYIRTYSSEDPEEALKVVMSLLAEVERVLLLILRGSEYIKLLLSQKRLKHGGDKTKH